MLGLNADAVLKHALYYFLNLEISIIILLFLKFCLEVDGTVGHVTKSGANVGSISIQRNDSVIEIIFNNPR